MIHGRRTLEDGRDGIGFTVMAHADGGSFGIPIAARVELGLGPDADVYLEVRRTGRGAPANGRPGDLVFAGVTAMHSGAEVYRRRDDDTTAGLEQINANEVLDVIVVRPRA